MANNNSKNSNEGIEKPGVALRELWFIENHSQNLGFLDLLHEFTSNHRAIPNCHMYHPKHSLPKTLIVTQKQS
ncbi:MAG: hypothetical protein LBT03_01695 [Holosporales bacterium]|nr:hypothetical protein [Holosporales bacterium]